MSAIYAIAGGQAVGGISTGHAALWPSLQSPDVIDLRVQGAHSSAAYATDGFWQGGYVRGFDGSYLHACIWKGSADSLLDMHNPVARTSVIKGMAVGAQVGHALIYGILHDHAILWRDTPDTWTDMHPSFKPDTNSYLYATTGGMHVGRCDGRAGYWTGDDPDSFTLLDPYLPPGAGGSCCEDIDTVGSRVYIAGYAMYDYRQHAIVWIGTPIDQHQDSSDKQPESVRRP